MPITIISGGSGLIGKSLTNYLTGKGHTVIILTRNINKTTPQQNVTFSKWDPEKGIIDLEVLEKADYIVNLAGAGVMDHPWSADYKMKILESRTKSALLLADSLHKIKHKLKAFIGASAIGWYGSDEKNLTHPEGFLEDDPPAKNFLGETCLLWEQSMEGITDLHIRLVILRFGIVLSNDGGAYPEFIKSLKFGLASILGNGKQIVSWIHIHDLCRMIDYAIDHQGTDGIYNAVAPEPARNKELILETAKNLKKNFFIPVHVPKFVLNTMLGERSVEILKSTKVNCRKIKIAGFTFLYPSLKLALENLSSQSKDHL